MKIQSYSRAMDRMDRTDPMGQTDQIGQMGPFESAAQGRSPIDLSPLLGTWINFDKRSRGTARVILSRHGDALQLHTFGAGSPELYDWGTAPATAFAGSVRASRAVGFRAAYDFGFLETVVAAYLNKRLLVFDTYNTFRDNSGRSPYFLRDHFYQETRPSTT